MRIQFLTLAPRERALFLEQAARRRGIHAAIMEKDFWVCWLLGVLFSHPELAPHLTFKGGTSLAKVFGAIGRFSEDIDLSLAPEFLGISEAEVEGADSRNRRTRWMNQLQDACATAANDRMRPLLEPILTDVLGSRSGGKPWLEFEIDASSHSPCLAFHYPSAQTGFDYLRRAVKLELGSLTDQQPTGRHPIRPWVADQLGVGFDDWSCDVVALEAERSFWEKATILHVEFHRKADEPMPPRYSRHYADLASLARHSIAERALADADLRRRVVDWKNRFFARSWGRYDLAVPGSFRLAPPTSRSAELHKDYADMREMYLDPPRSFEEVVADLEDLERRINAERAP